MKKLCLVYAHAVDAALWNIRVGLADFLWTILGIAELLILLPFFPIFLICAAGLRVWKILQAEGRGSGNVS